MNKILGKFLVIYATACALASSAVLGVFIGTAVDNKALGYFKGELFQYNPAKDKKALIITDTGPVEIDMDCSENSEGKYDIALYAHTADRVTIFNVVTNDEYRSIYGMDHPCHKE
ncbi:hypothetical protein [Nitrosomonas marina]|uniref:Uncharacterized protein n=1 Tax=Nitrosomonas marina TaxID=917 RepID=A0A1H8II90_9PROT|nr:hypothetical protein [Nitrosomonas marina]SEN67999.1 hypothetical protein SAMN05216325_1337 [Nitrosomonas marina]